MDSTRWAQQQPYGTSAIPYIGENGNWWVNQEDTGVKAQGEQGPEGPRGPVGIGEPLRYEDMTEEQKLELVGHYTEDMVVVKEEALVARDKAEMASARATAASEYAANSANGAMESAQVAAEQAQEAAAYVQVIAQQEERVQQTVAVMDEKIQTMAALNASATSNANRAEQHEGSAKTHADAAAASAEAAEQSVDGIDKIKRDAQMAASDATRSAIAAADSANTSAVNAKETQHNKAAAEACVNSAHEEAERAKAYAENASAITNVHIAQRDRAGVIKGGDNYVAEDGTLQLTTRTTKSALHNSCAGGIKLHTISGMSEQDTTAGVQLFMFEDGLSVGNTGVTVTANEDGSLSILGKSNAAGGVFVLGSAFSGADVVYTLKAGEYYVSGLPEGLSFFMYKTGDTVLSIPITTTEGGFVLDRDTDFCSISLRWSAGTLFNHADVRIMLNKGTTALPWEPYTGGEKAPNPAYSIDIKSVVISEIKVSGKNLLQHTATTQTINGVTFTVNEDGSVTANGTATANANFYLKQSLFDKELVEKEVIVSGCPSGGGENTYMLYMYNQNFGNGRFDIGNG